MKIKIDPKAKALIFDVDGTLVDTMSFHYKAWQEVGRRNGFDYPKSIFYEFAGVPTGKIIPILNKRFGLKMNVAKTCKIKEEYFYKYLNRIKIIEPVTELVYKYFEKLPMSVGTGSKKQMVRKILAAADLAQYFEVIVSADDVTRHKPEPDTFLRCAELMNVPPRFCQVFEDGEPGLLAGKAAGMIVTDVRKYL
jgi:beta-phosphoglucomutase family hydrolase